MFTEQISLLREKVGEPARAVTLQIARRRKMGWSHLMPDQDADVTDHTWNPWRGCTKVSPGCAHCYMFRQQRQYGNDPAVVVRTKTWRDPLKWQKQAQAAGRVDLVFTASWSDWFHEDADAWRPEAWELVRRCPNLVFQLLTKRPERIADHLPPDWGGGYPNAWLGVSVESNDYVWRADVLRGVPARLRWVCAEPLL